MKYATLRGAIHNLGPHVRHLAVHPTRPWLAILRVYPNFDATVEHYDFLTRTTLHTTEVSGYALALTWVGDRIVLALSGGDEPIEIDECDDIDIVSLPGLGRPLSSRVHRWIWGVEIHHSVFKETVVTIVARHGGRLHVRQSPADATMKCWHPDGSVYAALTLCGVDPNLRIVEGKTCVSHALPEALQRSHPRLLGWTGCDQVLALDGLDWGFSSSVTPWLCSTTTGAWTRCATVPRVREVALSPDGTQLALLTETAKGHARRLVLLESTSGRCLLDRSVDTRGEATIRWVGPQTVLVSGQETPYHVELVTPGLPVSRHVVLRGRVALFTQVEVHPVGAKLLFTRDSHPYAPFVTEDVVPVEPLAG